MKYYERVRKQVSEFGSWFRGAPDSLSVAAQNLTKRWQQDAARWHAASDKDSHDDACGIFDGTTTVGTPPAYGEYATTRQTLSKGGLSVAFHCPRCSRPRLMSADWLELAAICVDAAPQLFPARLRAAWHLEEPTQWWKATSGGWSPVGFRCSCGQRNGPCEYEYWGGVTTGVFHGLPKLYPAEVRALLFGALNERQLPRWFFPAAAVYAGLKGPHAARERVVATCQLARKQARNLARAVDQRLRRWWEQRKK